MAIYDGDEDNDETCYDCGQPVDDCCCGYQEDNGDDNTCNECGEELEECTCNNDDDTCPDCGRHYDDCYCDDEELHQSNIAERDDDDEESISKFINVNLTNITATIKVISNKILFKVISQNESTRNFNKLAFYNDFAIQGINYPHIEKNKILLRGKMTFNDEHESAYEMSNNAEAMAYADNIYKALKMWDQELSPQTVTEGAEQISAAQTETKPPEVTEQQKITIDQLKAFMTQQRETKITQTPTGGFMFS
jgi:hypothetical protein